MYSVLRVFLAFTVKAYEYVAISTLEAVAACNTLERLMVVVLVCLQYSNEVEADLLSRKLPVATRTIYNLEFLCLILIFLLIFLLLLRLLTLRFGFLSRFRSSSPRRLFRLFRPGILPILGSTSSLFFVMRCKDGLKALLIHLGNLFRSLS